MSTKTLKWPIAILFGLTIFIATRSAFVRRPGSSRNPLPINIAATRTIRPEASLLARLRAMVYDIKRTFKIMIKVKQVLRGTEALNRARDTGFVESVDGEVAVVYIEVELTEGPGPLPLLFFEFRLASQDGRVRQPLKQSFPILVQPGASCTGLVVFPVRKHNETSKLVVLCSGMEPVWFDPRLTEQHGSPERDSRRSRDY